MSKDTTYSSIWLFNKYKYDKLSSQYKDSLASNSTDLVRGTYYSEFNPTLCKNIISYWTEKGDKILDPFGGRTRALISMFMDRDYIGFEISKTTANHVNNYITKPVPLIPFKYKSKIINDDVYNIDKNNLKEESFDLIFSCPPYWNIEKYESSIGQLSDINNYAQFLERYKLIFQKLYKYLKYEKYLVLVIGDFRFNGKYYSFHCDNIKIMEDIGFKLHDIIINQSVTFDVACRRWGGFKHKKITAKCHEYILVFKKVKQK